MKLHPANTGAGGGTPVGRKRYAMALLCLWITTICYADRTNIGIALPSFVDSKEEQGEVLSAFFYGYMATQILGGYFATKLGAKMVLLTGVVVWTLFDLSTIFVSKCAWCLFLARAGMGL
uniref:Major facilitator superfamily (MFS) profile domain-containing protein n=1 Tax=Globisporangium ultimum (strain ATCC 200006 / CBS 805.95 / DAOM BR144) TaxID=431595 RepID=K3WG25_GLOUD